MGQATTLLLPLTMKGKQVTIETMNTTMAASIPLRATTLRNKISPPNIYNQKILIVPDRYPELVINATQRYSITTRLQELANMYKETNGFIIEPKQCDYKSGAMVIAVDYFEARQWIEIIIDRADWSRQVPFKLTTQNEDFPLAPAYSVWTPEFNSTFDDVRHLMKFPTADWRVLREYRFTDPRAGKKYNFIALDLQQHLNRKGEMEFSTGFSTRNGCIRALDRPKRNARRNRAEEIDEHEMQRRRQRLDDLQMLEEAKRLIEEAAMAAAQSAEAANDQNMGN